MTVEVIVGGMLKGAMAMSGCSIDWRIRGE